MSIKFYNTLGRKKIDFKPILENEVSLYTCGPTVYNYAHIGNLRTYIFEDILKKTLEFNGLKVKHVMNITDVGHLESDSDTGEDKMVLGAQREGKTVWEIARFYEEKFFEDCVKLNIAAPNISCRATEHIQQMIKFIRKLEEKGYTYISNGNVYFSIDKFPSYSDFAGLNMEGLEAGKRIEIDEGKRNPMDFVLWFTNSKFKNQIMQWDSPWGRGFPGWHLECSVMSMEYLGEKIDIHCGGVDHIPIHHTNEIAQSESATGKKWVNYWIHGEFLVLQDGKMSKSKGEFLTVSLLEEKGYEPIHYRFMCLLSRYRKQLVFSYMALDKAKQEYELLKEKIKRVYESLSSNEGLIDNVDTKKYIEKFREQINDDLNTPNGITVIYEVLKDKELNAQEKIFIINEFDKVLSLDLMNFSKEKSQSDIDEERINKLLIERAEARKNKDWSKADEIRDLLEKMNIEIIDNKEVSTWKFK
ncbi:cysteine--tRNA ligase [Oceanirhabdus sp. W0125-5]|uniref:cysteine--tRNA ligase n=1 Tax=Oceanirhabdus sp. W0125-5 TaxID=2999116 RepID=UPI0022F2A770|nr:cysteine--tRNA ligase [Oceanirhabdus sp. W0125-5]WBW94697.1 cysteine--tRNA ligase [Oceanirhabdus sp. W0125-5]